MATRSLIGIVLKDEKKINAVYCHWDGYLAGNGDLLLKNYNNYENVMNLINHGSFSSLREDINDIEFYKKEEIYHFDNILKLDHFFRTTDCEYLYLFAPDKDGNYRWIYKEFTYTKKPVYFEYNGIKEVVDYKGYWFLTKYRELTFKEIEIEELAGACYITTHNELRNNPDYKYYFDMINVLNYKNLKKARDLEKISRFECIKYLRILKIEVAVC